MHAQYEYGYSQNVHVLTTTTYIMVGVWCQNGPHPLKLLSAVPLIHPSFNLVMTVPTHCLSTGMPKLMLLRNVIEWATPDCTNQIIILAQMLGYTD
jgi:hypothetical protein